MASTLRLADQNPSEGPLTAIRDRFAETIDRSSVAMAVLSPAGEHLLVNASYCDMVGRSERDVLSLAVSDVTHPDDADGERRALESMCNGTSDRYTGQKRYLRDDGQIVWGLVDATPIRSAEGELLGFLGQVQDITELKLAQHAAEQQLSHRALHDAVTDLPNRALLIDRLSQSLARLERSSGLVAVLFLDLDHFKVVGDVYGRAFGDAVLHEVTQRIRHNLRAGDTAARVGADEFVICYEEVSSREHARTMARRISECIEIPFKPDGEHVCLTASIGIALSGDAGDDPEALVADAELAMKRAKQRGRSRSEFFSQTLRSHVVTRVEIQRDLQQALQNNEFEVHYQPIFSVADKTVAGAEALVRWNHPERGRVSPADFIPIAEDTGLIVPLGNWILEEACRRAVDWQGRHNFQNRFTMSVNLSVRQLDSEDVLTFFADILARTGADARDISLEITESVLIEETDFILEALVALKALGLKLGLDDFGTRYSSLTYLRHFPFDTVKVDQSFVKGICQSSQDRAIVTSVVGLAHALGLGVVAEGVETQEQFEVLRGMRAHRAQGYYLARPMPAAEFERLLSERG